MVRTYHNQNIFTLFITVTVATCGYPLFGNENSEIQITGYSDPAIEGRNVSIHCPPGMVLMVMETIASTLVCTGNGEWEPDPRKVACVHPATTAKIINCLNINLSFVPRLLNLLQRV